MNTSERFLQEEPLSKEIIRDKAHSLKPIVQIGKLGLTQSCIEEIDKHLKKRKLIKIKCLKYFIEQFPGDESNMRKVKAVADVLAEKLAAEVVQATGFMISLYKRG